MKRLGLIFFIFCSAAHATSVIIETETKEILLSKPPQFNVRCVPGTSGRYPTPSELVLQNVGTLFSKAKTKDIYYWDKSNNGGLNTGDNCYELATTFASVLPVKLTITRTLRETCYLDNTYELVAKKSRYETLEGKIVNFDFMGGETISQWEVLGGTCP